MRTTLRSPARAAAALLLCAIGGSASAQTITPFTSATASAWSSSYPPAQAVDGNLSTRWQTSGVGQSITGTLPQEGTLTAVRIAWYRGASRRYTFRIEAAGADGVFRAVFSGSSSGTTAQRERYAFPPVGAQQVKVVVNGNTVNAQAAIREMDAELSGSASPGAVAVSVSPSSATVAPGASQQFTATVTGAADTSVAWSVTEGASGGSVDAAGLYTAPATAGTYHVVATSSADATRTASATVNVADAAPPPPPPTASASCDAAPMRTTGTVTYYCDCQSGSDPSCVPGNDANAGTSPAAPRRTLGNAASRFGSMASGDTIALCRGGAWTSGFGYLPNKSCGTTDGTSCDIRDYVPSWGSASTPKPLVDLGSGGFGLAFVNSTRGAKLWNVTFRSTTANHDAGDGMVGVYDSADGLDICNVTVDGGKVGFNIQSSGTAPSTLRESTITEIGQTGIYHAASNWTFDRNVFANNQQALAGGACGGYCGSYYNHDHYVSGTASNVVIKNSEYYTTADHCTNAGRCAGVVIYWTDFQTDPIFENNYVHGPGQSSRYGFSSSNNAANTSNYRGIVRRNRFELPNAGTAVELSACTDCQLTDNVVVVGAGAHGLGVPEQTGQSNPVNGGTIVRNNTVYLTGPNGVGIHQNAEGSGYAFENNVVYGPSGTTCFRIVNPLASGHPFTSLTYPATGANAAGNYCVNDGAAPSTFFVDAPGGNFTPVPGGPLSGTGTSTYASPTAIGSVTWSPDDGGKARTAPIDIGAYDE